jgi:hypothetical protein
MYSGRCSSKNVDHPGQKSCFRSLKDTTEKSRHRSRDGVNKDKDTHGK